MTYEQIIQKAGKRIIPRVYYYENGVETSLDRDDFQQAKFKFNASLVGTVMYGVELEVKTLLPDTLIFIEITAKYDIYTQRKVFGGYLKRGEPTYNADNKTYTYEMYDKIITAMVDYKPISIAYPTTIYSFFRQLITELGFTSNIASLPNGTRTIEKDIYDGINYTYRDVLNDIGQATGTLFVIDDNEIKKCELGTSTKTINDDILKNQNITLGKHFGPINTIVLTRSGESDSIYYPEVLPENPIEFRIADNQLMNENDREDYLEALYNQLNGIEFDIYDTALVGYGGFTPLEKIQINTGGKEYNSYVFNNEITISQGYEEVIYTEMPTETSTDYKASDSTDRRINQVYIIARKLEKEIVAVVDTTNKIQKEINPTKDESGSEIIVEDASNNPLINLEIEGKSTQATRSGKNYIKYNNAVDTALNGLEFIFNEDGTIKVNGTATSNTQFYYILNGTIPISAGTYTFSGSIGGSMSTYRMELRTSDYIYFHSYDNSETITLSSDVQIVSAYIYVNNGATLNNVVFKPQLEAGEEATEYEPYGVSPSPDYPSKIESVGYENLLNVPENYSITLRNSLNMNISKGTYMLSFDSYTSNGDSNAFLIQFNNSSATISKYFYFTSKEATFELEQDFTSITIYSQSAYNNSVDITTTFNKLMITKGAKKRSYISYGKYGIEVETSNENDKNTLLIVLNEPLRSLPNGVKDIAYIKNNKLYVDRYVGSVVLDGSENWNKYGADGTINQLRTTINDKPKYFGSNIVDSNSLMCSHFISTIYKNYWTINNSILFALQNSLFIQTEQTVDEFKTWLSAHNAQVIYELATPYTEELGEIEMLKTLKGYNDILTTDELLPIINLTYVRDTILADYVENHVTELKLTESEIKASVESVSSSVDGLNTSINRVEEITTSNSQVINVISTSSSFDLTTGEVREVTTTTGFTFNADGMTIDDGSGFKAEHRAEGTYYKDGTSTIGQYTKDGSKQKDLELFGIYSYGKNDLPDTPMFIAQLFTDENGEECFGHFYNGGDY